MRNVRIGLANQDPPKCDGQIKRYRYFHSINRQLDLPTTKSRYFDQLREVIFINGMLNSGLNHQSSAWKLSYVQMCTVIGVYNKTDSFSKDLGQCIMDKGQFHGPLLDPYYLFASALKQHQEQNRIPVDRGDFMAGILSRNLAAVSLFDLLRSPLGRQKEIFAHSQGNLILSNVLTAISIVDGPAAIRGHRVHSFGSPALNWPEGISRKDHAFTFDPISWMDWNFNFKVAKVGGIVAHNFLAYMNNDPEFTVNRRRWGGLGITFSMDEEGLADDLISFGNNHPRIQAIFEYLDAHHNSDADDVAFQYVKRMRMQLGEGGAKNMLTSMKSNLVPLLVKLMEEGITTDDEKKCIAYLKAL